MSHENFVETLLCESCGLIIHDGEKKVNYGNNKWWHLNHFKCSTCQDIITCNLHAYAEMGHLVCLSHRTNLSSHVCAQCKQPIFDPQSINVLGMKWHVACFKCFECGQRLQGTFNPIENIPYCKRDFLKLSGLMCSVCSKPIETGKVFLVIQTSYP
jgi:hypothetical protein